MTDKLVGPYRLIDVTKSNSRPQIPRSPTLRSWLFQRKTAAFAIALVLVGAAVAPSFIGAIAYQGPTAPLKISNTSIPSFSVALNVSSLTMAQGTTAHVGIIVRSINGFNDTIAMSVNTMPTPPATSGEGFTIIIVPNTFSLTLLHPNASLVMTITTYDPAFRWYPALGTYTVNVFGTSQTAPLQFGQASLQLTVSNAPPVSYTSPAGFLYALGYIGSAYPGAQVQLQSNFTNIGTVNIKVTQLSVASDFGNFSQPSGLPLEILPGQMQTLSMIITIPSGTAIGSHYVSATIHWQFYNSTQWLTANPHVVNGTMQVTSAPQNPIVSTTSSTASSIRNLVSTNLGSFLAALAAYVMMAGLAAGVVIRDDHRKQQAITLSPISVMQPRGY